MKTSAVILLVSAVLSFVIVGVLLRKMDYSQYKNESDCNRGVAMSCKDKSCCACWDGSQCSKGTLSGFECTCKGSILPAVFSILGLCLLVLSIIAFFRKSKQTV